MWGRGRGIHRSGSAHTGTGEGQGGTRCYAKQPHLTDEIITPTGWGRGGGRGDGGGGGEGGESRGTRERERSKKLCAFCPHPLHLPTSARTSQEPWPSICPFLPPSSPEAPGPGAEQHPLSAGWQAGREASRVQMQGPRVLSWSQVLQRLVAFLLQVTVVILLGRQRHTVQWVMGVQPLLLLQCQALQLSGLRVHGLQLVSC